MLFYNNRGFLLTAVLRILDVPYGNSDWNANVFYVNTSGNLDDNWTNNSNGVRPVEIPTTISKYTNVLKIYVYGYI